MGQNKSSREHSALNADIMYVNQCSFFCGCCRSLELVKLQTTLLLECLLLTIMRYI